ncbi:MAG TPA: serine protease [Actinobacteria bacterium]|nr:serine protease [Actinomycetota bacterium]
MTPDRCRSLLPAMAWAPLVRALAVAVPFALTLVMTTPADGDGIRLPGRLAVTAPAGKISHRAPQAPQAPRAPQPQSQPQSLPLMAAGRSFGGTPAVGALFVRNGSAALGTHFCSASVVDSPSGNLVLTAAHCLNGLAADQLSFVPGYHDGLAPYGVWAVRRMITDQRWAASSDPDDDFAFLEVSPPARLAWGARVQDITGGEVLGGESAGGPVTVIGYPNSRRSPIFCRNRARPFAGKQLEFACDGYAEGTSGSPLLADVNPATWLGTVVGVIGGYERGGHTSDVSYAARFGGAIGALYQAASALSVWAAAVGGRPARPPG